MVKSQTQRGCDKHSFLCHGLLSFAPWKYHRPRGHSGGYMLCMLCFLRVLFPLIRDNYLMSLIYIVNVCTNDNEQHILVILHNNHNIQILYFETYTYYLLLIKCTFFSTYRCTTISWRCLQNTYSIRLMSININRRYIILNRGCCRVFAETFSAKTRQHPLFKVMYR